MSSSSSSSDDRSHHGGAKLVPQPRRQPSTIAPPPAPAKESTNKKLQATLVSAPDSPTPLPKGQRTAERAVSHAFPVYYPAQGQMQMPFMNVAYPTYAPPSYNVPSESSASSGPLPSVRLPTGYNPFISSDDGRDVVLSSQSSTTSASVDVLSKGLSGMKLKENQQQANMYIRHIQQQIYDLLQQSYQQTDLSPRFKMSLDHKLKELAQSLGNLQGFVDRVATEADRENQTFQATAGAQAVEIEYLKSNFERARRSLSLAEKSNADVQDSYQGALLSSKEHNAELKQQLEELRKQLQTCQEQLEGKRDLFYTAHDDVEGKARILSMISDSDYREKAKVIQHMVDSDPLDKAKILEILFSNNAQAPAHNRSVSYQPNMMAIQSGSATPGGELAWTSRRPSRVTPPAPSMRRTPLVYQSGSVMGPPSAMHQNNRFSQPRSRPSTGRPPSNRVDSGTARYRFDDPVPSASAQEFGSPQLSRSRQMVLAQNEVELTQTIEMWKEDFSKIFRMVHGWASRYAHQVQPDQARVIRTEAPRLWDFMCDILYPGQPEAAVSHANFLLEDQQCRSYFVERMMLQYVVNNIFSVEGWMRHSPETDRELKDLDERLRSTEVFKTYIRQTITDQISTIIGTILADPSFTAYRAKRINYHQERLKTIVGPLMDPSASRSDASFDLNAIASSALQCSAQMFQSRLSFEFSWSRTCSKFSLDFHVVKDPPLEPLMLQAKQYRLKLVVTPAILFRDDRTPGVSSNPKRVLRSEVFVMN